jgi:peptidoglycan/LPS O-acetylase OafA/YrhL
MKRFAWLDPLKGFALLAILLNHLVEELGSTAWFTNPSASFPPAGQRLSQLIPSDHPWPLALVHLLGWLGDSGPGVFILASGFGLTWSEFSRGSATDSRDFGAYLRHRLWRLYPLAVAAHLLILGLALFVPATTATFADPRTLLSLAALRFTTGLFFYISPAWWYLWLALQLYLLFPALHWLLRRAGTVPFLLITLVITVLSRAAGLGMGDMRYDWLTGLFAGCRLAEFAAGMALAQYLANHDEATLLRSSRLLPISLALYLLGIAASLSLPTVLVSNLLVTLGLSGLFAWIWDRIVRPVPLLDRGAQWLGRESYAVFLVHHPLLRWTAFYWPGPTAAHAAAGIIALGASFPLGAGLSSATDQVTSRFSRASTDWNRLGLVTGACLIAVALALAGEVEMPRAMAYLFGVGFLLAAAAEWRVGGTGTWGASVVRRTGLGTSLLLLFVLPRPEVFLSLGAALVGAAILGGLERTALPRLAALASAPLIVLGCALGAESGLAHLRPMEAGRWGEFPALTPHPTRAYALKPDLSLRLRYNDYDYPLVTNADSLIGPRVPPVRTERNSLRILTVGDAFTMPEGLPAASGWPALLGAQLRRCLAPRTVEVINAGVTGYGPAEEAPLVEELVPRYHPDVVLYEFFVNEFDEAALSTAARRASIGWGESQSRRARLLERSQLVARGRRVDAWWHARLTGALTPNEAWVAMTAFYAAGPSPRYSPERLDLVEGYLARMARAAGQQHAALIMYYVPGAMGVDSTELDVPADRLARAGPFDTARPAALAAELAARAGIAEEDLTPALRAWGERPRYFPRAWHWTEAGHRAAAHAVLASLQRRGLLAAECTP